MLHGARKPTLGTVAQLAGVSAPTVSKVVNGREDVSPETRARVLAVLAKVGYSSPAQRRKRASAPAGRTAVELVFDTFTSVYAAEVLGGILEHAATVDVEVIIGVGGTTSARAVSPELHAQRLVEAGRAGLIVVTSGLASHQLAAFRRNEIPVVVIDPLNSPPGDVISVGVTNWAGGKAATEHLLELGHQRIGFLGGPEAAECSQARLHGYMAALMARGFTVDPRYVLAGSFTRAHGIKGLAALMDLPQPPTAIFAASDDIAIGVQAGARTRGMQIPDDLSLVGFNGTFQAVDAVPPLTSVAQPLREIGRTALRTILRRIRGEEVDSQRVELATSLVIRESTAPLMRRPGDARSYLVHNIDKIV